MCTSTHPLNPPLITTPPIATPCHHILSHPLTLSPHFPTHHLIEPGHLRDHVLQPPPPLITPFTTPNPPHLTHLPSHHHLIDHLIEPGHLRDHVLRCHGILHGTRQDRRPLLNLRRFPCFQGDLSTRHVGGDTLFSLGLGRVTCESCGTWYSQFAAFGSHANRIHGTDHGQQRVHRTLHLQHVQSTRLSGRIHHRQQVSAQGLGRRRHVDTGGESLRIRMDHSCLFVPIFIDSFRGWVEGVFDSRGTEGYSKSLF